MISIAVKNIMKDSLTDVEKQFQKLTVWKRAGERAPHKPLLVLYAMGRLLRDEPRLISYEEIDEKLGNLLRTFGPTRSHYHPEYPFWRLQKDFIWEIDGKEKLTLTKSGDVRKKDLISLDVKGGFSETIFQQLMQKPDLAKKIVQYLLDSNFPDTIHEDILQAVGIDISVSGERKKRSPDFRDKILRAYDYKCAVCGFDVRMEYYPVALEAAHIKWHNAGGPDIEVNGMALCALHHKLFDRGAFTFTDDMTIMVSDRANGNQGFQEWLMKFHGGRLRFPQRAEYLPRQTFRKWHVKEVFQGEFRA